MEQAWQHRGVVAWMLYPLSLLFALIAAVRRASYKINFLESHAAGAPVIVVGNITVGGSGKTPMVVWLCSELKRLGKTPGIISRGYGGKAESWPQDVTSKSDPQMVGDEAVLLTNRTGCPMVVGPDRVAAAQMLFEKHGVDIIISDDGLQHYRMRRDIELVVIDGERRFGNRFPLPAGPLREPVSRLNSVDYIINNGGNSQGQEVAMSLLPGALYNLKSDEELKIEEFIEKQGNAIHAVAGIGNPSRLFRLLTKQGFAVTEHPFADHHPYQESDLEPLQDHPIIMTEKDAVKCATFTTNNNCWVLPVEAQLKSGFVEEIIRQLEKNSG